MKITYYHTLYKREVVDYTDKVEFKEDGIEYASLGHKTFIKYENVKRIENEE